MSSTIRLTRTTAWTQTAAEVGNTNNTTSDAGQMSYQYNYANGSGTGVINEVFHQYATLSSGGTGNYNLCALTQNLLGYSVNKSFTQIRGIDIKNYSTVSGYDIDINLSSSSGFKSAFGYPTGVIRLEANTEFTRNSVFGGWPVSTGGERQIQLVDRGLGATYEISIWGTTG